MTVVKWLRGIVSNIPGEMDLFYSSVIKQNHLIKMRFTSCPFLQSHGTESQIPAIILHTYTNN